MKITKLLSTLIATIVLVSAVGCASTAKHEGTGEYVDDSLITTKVKAEILAEPKLNSMEINVETFKGRVQLSGFVHTPADITRAAEVARHVKGVTEVKNDLIAK